MGMGGSDGCRNDTLAYSDGIQVYIYIRIYIYIGESYMSLHYIQGDFGPPKLVPGVWKPL